MGELSIFFNKRIIITDKASPPLSDALVAFGNFFLTPVYCLFNGETIFISCRERNARFCESAKNSGCTRFLQVIASIIFLVPGLLSGTLFKGLGYLSKNIRESHSIARQSQSILPCTPFVPQTVPTQTVQTATEPPSHRARIDIGTTTDRLDLESIKKRLEALKGSSGDTIVIYAALETHITDDPGLLALNPKKIILVGATMSNKMGFPKNWFVEDTLAEKDARYPKPTPETILSNSLFSAGPFKKIFLTTYKE